MQLPIWPILRKQAGWLCVLVLTGCKLNIGSEVTVQQIDEAVTSMAKDEVPMQLEFEMPSRQTCAEQGSSVVGVLRDYVKSIGAVNCIDRGFDNYLQVATTTDLMTMAVSPGKQQQTLKPDTSAVSLLIVRQGQDTAIGLVFNGERVSSLQSKLQQQFKGSNLTLEVHEAKVVIYNDTRAARQFNVPDSFVNGQPTAASAITINPRTRVEIKLSDVQRGLLRGKNYGAVAYLPPRS